MRYGHEGSRHPTINEEGIYGFFDDYRFLSNFHVCPVNIDGRRFESSEAAYMSFKTTDEATKDLFMGDLKPAKYKQLGQEIVLRPDWEAMKVLCMTRVVHAKFDQNPDLWRKLIDTEKLYLEETNDWNDRFWGADIFGSGHNMLGKILMFVRGII
jgi:ribA/ribD-fused uncharacterized protein